MLGERDAILSTALHAGRVGRLDILQPMGDMCRICALASQAKNRLEDMFDNKTLLMHPAD